MVVVEGAGTPDGDGPGLGSDLLTPLAPPHEIFRFVQAPGDALNAARHDPSILDAVAAHHQGHGDVDQAEVKTLPLRHLLEVEPRTGPYASRSPHSVLVWSSPWDGA